MNDVANPKIINESIYKKYIPWLTAICCLASIILFIGINLEPGTLTWDIYKKWGSPSREDIWDGDYWGLFTSNFLHIEIWHIAFNLYWFWSLGKKIEFESSKLFYVILIISSALISSMMQLIFSVPGIGLSGIVYALFGYILVMRKSDKYAGFIDQKTINWFIIWLLLCVVLTYAKIWKAGNAAHIGGFLWGLLIGKLSGYNKAIRIAIPLMILGMLLIPVFWQPRSIAWLSHKAYNLHKNEKLDEAEKLYKEILEKKKDDEFAKKNLEAIQIYKLSREALDAHKQQDYEHALKLYKQILVIDSANKWARENMAHLPIK